MLMAGACLMALLFLCTAELDIQNPAAIGVVRELPWMSQFGEQWLTNPNPQAAYAMLIGGTNALGSFITNNQSGVTLPSGTFMNGNFTGTFGGNGSNLILLNPANLTSGGTANINILGNASTASTANFATTAASATTAWTAESATNAGYSTNAGNASNSSLLASNPPFVYLPAFQLTNHVAYFGAFPNGYVYNDISVTNRYLTINAPIGNAPTITSAMVGWRIIVNFAGSGGKYYQGIISNVVSSTAIWLQTAVASPITNLTYAVICTTNSELTNDIAFQAMLNNISNSLDSTLIIDPPSFYTQVLGSNNVGSCYVLETNWQNAGFNNSILRIPPILGSNPLYYGTRPVVHIKGNAPFFPWPYLTYMTISPNQSAIIIDGDGGGVTPTNYIGGSFLDTRPFNVGAINGSGPNAQPIPCNDVTLDMEDFAIIHSYDSGFVTFNLSGLADGGSMQDVVDLGGDIDSSISGACYEFALGNYPTSTNSIGVIWPNNFQGTFYKAYYDIFSGEWADMEEGLVQGDELTCVQSSNVIDFAYSSAIRMDFTRLNIGGAFNVNHVRIGIQQPPKQLNEDIIDLGNNVMPSGTQIQLFADDYWQHDLIHDGFYTTAGTIDFYTNVNQQAGVTTTWTNWNINGNLNGLVLKLHTASGISTLSGNLGFNNNSMTFNNASASFTTGGAITVSNTAGANVEFLWGNGGDASYIATGTRGRVFWNVGPNDALNLPIFDSFPAADYTWKALNPGTGGASVAGFDGGGTIGVWTTNGTLAVYGNLILNGQMQTTNQIGYVFQNTPTFSNGVSGVGFALNSSSDASAIQAGTRGTTWFKIQMNDAIGYPVGTDPFPVADFSLKSIAAGGVGGASGFDSGGTIFVISTNGNELLWGNLYLGGSLVNTNGGAYIFSGNGSGLTNISSTSLNYAITRTNFLSGAYYTNNTGAAFTVFCDEFSTAAASAGTSGFILLYDPSGGHNWQTNQDGRETTTSLSIAGMVSPNRFSAPVSSGGVYCFSNFSTVGSATLLNGYIKQ